MRINYKLNIWYCEIEKYELNIYEMEVLYMFEYL